MINIIYNRSLTKTDPETSQVLIIGRLANLVQVGFQALKCKLEPRVTKEVFKNALRKLKVSEMCSLYLNSALMIALPYKCSRHNTPSRSHALTRLVQAYCTGDSVTRYIVIVCEHGEVFASGCAIPRALPLFSKKTDSTKTQQITIYVEFFVISTRQASTDSALFDVVDVSHEEMTALDHACNGISLAARITDTPCNEMNIDDFLQEIYTIGSQLHIKPIIIRGRLLMEKGFGGIWGVGQAASQPPALAVLSYTPRGAYTTIAWVGKGIVYDTGGLCLKGRVNILEQFILPHPTLPILIINLHFTIKNEMPHMKQDCGGAAAILGAFYAMVRSNFNQNLHAVFCLAENAIGPLATRPDDIHTLYSGLTVEINNTDAEGRLVLADGVVYAQRTLKADIIVDMATLTGAQGVSTGIYHAAVLTNSEDWEGYCMQAGRTSGDLVFPIPYTPELHFREFDSACADMKNTMARGNNAACSCAGLFINAHLGFDFSGIWIHIDMASPVRQGDRATGYGVALLCTLFGSLCRQPMLQSIAPEIEINRVHNARSSSKQSQ